jgi:hypothetical protein
MLFTKSSKESTRYLVGISMLLLLILVGCMSTRSAERHQTAIPFTKSQFVGKSIAILPVSEAKTTFATESNRGLRLAVSEALDNKATKLIETGKISKHKMCASTLNDSNKLNLLEDLFKTYEVTGSYDNKTIIALCDTLNADYLVVSKLTAGKTDAILAKATTITLDVSIVSRQTKEVVWGGTGTYRKGGVMGFGGVDDKAVAEELVRLAFSNYE